MRHTFNNGAILVNLTGFTQNRLNRQRIQKLGCARKLKRGGRLLPGRVLLCCLKALFPTTAARHKQETGNNALFSGQL